MCVANLHSILEHHSKIWNRHPNLVMSMGTLEKTIKVLELLGGYPRGLSVSEISRTLDFPKSTTHRILNTFSRHGYIAQDKETKRYSLGLKLLHISSVILANLDIRKIAEGYLEELYEKAGEVVSMYILRNEKITCISKVGNPRGLTLPTFVGWTTEPHAAASGKVLLSDLTRERLHEIYQGVPLKKYGKKTITDFDELMEELEKVKKQGYAIDDEEYYEGVRCVAAPVRAKDKMVASISCTGPVFRMTMKRINKEMIQLVKETSEKISRDLTEVAILE